MTANAWLGRARYVDREINNLLAEKQETYNRLTNITQSYDKSEAQTSPDPHKFDKLVELEGLIDEKVDELAGIKAEIIRAIYTLQDGRQITVLFLYYVRLMTLEQIAVKLGYSYRQIINIRRRGIAEIQRTFGYKL